METTVTQATTLLEAVATLYPNTTRAKIRKMLTEGRVLVDGEVQHKAKHPLEVGQTVVITDRAKGKEAAPPPISTKKQQLEFLIMFRNLKT